MTEPSPRVLRVMGALRWALVLLSAVVAGLAWWGFARSGGSIGAVVSQAKYQCPMHPGIVSATPGTCPICGMDLVPITVTPDTAAMATMTAAAPYTLEDAGAATIGDAGAARFFCPMHPDIRSHAPGRCPVCKMRLEPIPAAGEAAPSGVVPVTLTPDRMQSIGVRTAVATERDAGGGLRLTASVAAPESGVAEVHVRTPGFVERIAVRETGARVSAGQELLSLYSPEIFQAETELLAARSIGGAGLPAVLADAGGAGTDRVTSAARTRLELLGMPGRSIDEVLRTGRPLRAVPVTAPADGWVTKKGVVLGSYVTPETTLYEIVDLSRVYVVADVFAEDAADVPLGTPARFRVAGRPELAAAGTIDLVYPRTNPEARTTRVRMPLANPGMRFVPGQPGTLEVERPGHRGLFVPRDAVVDTGRERYVFVDLGGGHLVPRSVEVGRGRDEDVEIVRGLTAGERVVSGATFLIDSESRLRAAMSSAR